MKTENTPSETHIKAGQTIKLETRFGSLSRGKCWGKFFPGQKSAKGAFEWVAKSGGTLLLEGAGYYVVGSGDGYSRQATGEFCLLPATPETEKAAKIIELQESIAASLAKGNMDEILEVKKEGNSSGLPIGSYTRRQLMDARCAILADLTGNVDVTGLPTAEQGE